MVIDTSFVFGGQQQFAGTYVRHRPIRLHRGTYDHDGILGWWVWDIATEDTVNTFLRQVNSIIPSDATYALFDGRCSKGSNPPPSIGWGCRHPIHQSLHGLPSSLYVLIEDMVFRVQSVALF